VQRGKVEQQSRCCGRPCGLIMLGPVRYWRGAGHLNRPSHALGPAACKIFAAHVEALFPSDAWLKGTRKMRRRATRSL
jgi:hypothetical protein